jgi:DNA excision repair protein ERCC-4
MHGELIHVVADDREATCKVVEALRLHPYCKVEIRRLRIGDYQVAGQLLFERKTLRDLVVSIIDGRFLGQARRLASGPLRSIILLEGTARDLANSQMSREAIQGALITATIMLGIPLLRSRNPEESAQLMLFAARQSSALISGALPRVGARPKSKRALQLHILQGLPNIGPTRAARLIDRFGTVEGAITAAQEALAQVKGLGPRLAGKIRWSVSEPTQTYNVIQR